MNFKHKDRPTPKYELAMQALDRAGADFAACRSCRFFKAERNSVYGHCHAVSRMVHKAFVCGRYERTK